MRILVFQHIAAEHPGIFRDLMRADAIAWDSIELDQGQQIPPFDGYDALMVFGGPMDVWQEDRHPWLVAEKAAIRRWTAERRGPYLGVCLGHQLLADALGGTVGPMTRPEVGIFDVKLTPAGRKCRLLHDMPSEFPTLQWHGAEVRELPRDAVALAENRYCAIQAFQAGRDAYGIQYHVEQTEETVPEWGRITEYRCALEEIMGPGGQVRLEQDANRNLAAFGETARILYRNFRALIDG